jgi:hypothetical protein
LRLFFCGHQAQDLRQIRALADLTTCQSAAKLAVCFKVRPQPIRVSGYTRRRNATNHPCRAVRAHNNSCDIGKADWRARFMRYGAPRIGRTRRHDSVVYHQVVGGELGFVSHLENSLSIASHGARRLETFPKTATCCHLLPFCRRKTARPVVTVSLLTCPSRACRPAWAPG